jgi:NitT/TauT family transport system ATP-binding protein
MREPCTPPEIEFHQAVYTGRFRDSAAITVGPLSLRIGSGEFFAVLCPECDTRNILLRMIAGLVLPSSGEVRISGKKVESGRQDFGIVFEQPSLLEWRTLLENVLLQIELRRMDLQQGKAQARRLFAAVGLSGYEDRMPHALPLGLAQRVALCRALVHNPSLLLMEDPFHSLDGLDREQMAVDLQRLGLTPKVTVVLFTADIREAVQLSDRVAIMARDGRILQPVSIDLARPRRMDKSTTPKIAEYCSTIRTILHATGMLS